MYFTIVHWITLIVFLLLMIFVVIISYRNLNTKQFITASLFTIPLLTFGLIGSMYAVDSITKQVKLVEVSHRQVIRNETILFTGRVKNVGNFKVGTCYLEIDIYDTRKNKLSHGVFTPIVWFSDLFGHAEPPKPLFVTKEVLIAKNLEPGKTKTFTVSVRNPTYMQGMRINYKLIAH